jgi:hypothetical protein
MSATRRGNRHKTLKAGANSLRLICPLNHGVLSSLELTPDKAIGMKIKKAAIIK